MHSTLVSTLHSIKIRLHDYSFVFTQVLSFLFWIISNLLTYHGSFFFFLQYVSQISSLISSNKCCLVVRTRNYSNFYQLSTLLNHHHNKSCYDISICIDTLTRVPSYYNLTCYNLRSHSKNKWYTLFSCFEGIIPTTCFIFYLKPCVRLSWLYYWIVTCTLNVEN